VGTEFRAFLFSTEIPSSYCTRVPDSNVRQPPPGDLFSEALRFHRALGGGILPE
jgi:hypothetical protein